MDGGPVEAPLTPAPRVVYRVRFDSNWGTIEIPILGPKSCSQITGELQEWQVVQDRVMRAPIVRGWRDIVAVAWLS